ncbi:MULTISPECIES: ChbG/HpnK family deacetylase [unclassified Chelatococcus]|uniref:ChbG/HpnK family deacetylase n=1 Tax=unclassified Chelatococcus TaxID=2638111 RepID=UPI00224BD221|nr:ChbG/HpnK family deacetylase [Chelatococcus sp.]MCO5076114.1 ChbG/HpnK family deacetylase [Chelatococcus sp.]CAH1669312.1 putative Chitin disaccharide deacetylase [Hyphomicrobiales bacterium]CAH1679239.1 putative Chitin disaccharide deacetylase [Hyphomicrobiales bacterium]
MRVDAFGEGWPPRSGARPAFALCADDFAMTEGVSQAILSLAAQGRLSATSVMTTMPRWREFAPALREREAELAIGLHLNLTLGRPATAMATLAPDGRLPAFGGLATQSLTGRLRDRAARNELTAEIGAQLDLFTEAFGREPDYVDGHQHVHVLPGIRGALLACLRSRGLAGRLWLRDPSEKIAAILSRRGPMAKAVVIATLAKGWREAAIAAGFATNHGFAGVSAFRSTGDFGTEFASFLVAPGPRHLVMCHPGGMPRPSEADAELRALDPVVDSRPMEFAFLRSPRFAEICAAAGLALMPGSALRLQGVSTGAWQV